MQPMEEQDGFAAVCPAGHVNVAFFTSVERDGMASQVEPVRLFCFFCGEDWTPPQHEQAIIRRWARRDTN